MVSVQSRGRSRWWVAGLLQHLCVLQTSLWEKGPSPGPAGSPGSGRCGRGTQPSTSSRYEVPSS